MYTGFRYVEIRGYLGEVTPESITANFIHSDVDDATCFTCSSPLISRLEQISRQTFLSNLVNVPTDGPERERRGWTADAYAVSQAECIRFNMLNFYYAWFESMEDCQRTCGWIPVEFPETTCLEVDMDWPAAAVLIPYDIYEQYGDKAFAARYYEVMEKWVKLLERVADEEYTVYERQMTFRDWTAVEPATTEFLGICYFYRCADLLARLSDAIGRQDKAQEYRSLANSIRASINRRYLHTDGTDCYYDNGTQSACIHGLFFEICPPEAEKAMLQHLVRDLRSKGVQTTGFMGSMGLLQTLAKNGYAQDAYNLVCQPNLGGWVYAFTNRCATTFPAQLRGLDGSDNHAFQSGTLDAFFYQTILGITPAEPGYRSVKIAPFCPADMESASGCVETRFGAIRVKWVRNAVERRLKVEIPAGVTAAVTWEGRSETVASGSHCLSEPQ